MTGFFEQLPDKVIEQVTNEWDSETLRLMLMVNTKDFLSFLIQP